ncbi:MAG: hypothetical protein LKG19_03720 [Saprospiraceae bacterium]|jgi:hypothetical protein|nr:hypothetical protein [Saprospiraceae bacterium]
MKLNLIFFFSFFLIVEINGQASQNTVQLSSSMVTGSLDVYKGNLYLDGISIAYIVPFKNIRKYKYIELTDIVVGTFRTQQVDVKVLSLGLNVGYGIFLKQTMKSLIKIVFDFQLGIKYQNESEYAITSYGANNQSKFIAVSHYINPQANYDISENWTCFLGLSSKFDFGLRYKRYYSGLKSSFQSNELYSPTAHIYNGIRFGLKYRF